MMASKKSHLSPSFPLLHLAFTETGALLDHNRTLIRRRGREARGRVLLGARDGEQRRKKVDVFPPFFVRLTRFSLLLWREKELLRTKKKEPPMGGRHRKRRRPLRLCFESALFLRREDRGRLNGAPSGARSAIQALTRWRKQVDSLSNLSPAHRPDDRRKARLEQTSGGFFFFLPPPLSLSCPQPSPLLSFSLTPTTLSSPLFLQPLLKPPTAIPQASRRRFQLRRLRWSLAQLQQQQL